MKLLLFAADRQNDLLVSLMGDVGGDACQLLWLSAQEGSVHSGPSGLTACREKKSWL